MTRVRPPATGQTPQRALRRLAAPAAALAVVVGATAYVGSHDPHRPGLYPPCPLLQVTGLYCPGCGGLRTAHAVAHGDLPAALSTNAMVVAGFLAFALLWVWWCVRVIRARPLTVPVRAVHLWVCAGLGVAFTVVRNLPFGTALAP